MSRDTFITGTTVLRRTRAPKTYDDGRICAETGCDTKLSQYNRHPKCWNHAPTRFPRVRGRIGT